MQKTYDSTRILVDPPDTVQPSQAYVIRSYFLISIFNFLYLYLLR